MVRRWGDGGPVFDGAAEETVEETVEEIEPAQQRQKNRTPAPKATKERLIVAPVPWVQPMRFP